MEIHEPNGPLNSWGEVFKHLAIVTVGILIALGLEGCIEWKHHLDLVKEARANLLTEIRDNRAELEQSMSTMPQTEDRLHELLAQYEAAMDDKSGKVRRIAADYSFDDADLVSASWTTAQTTTALGYMPYSEVKRFAGVYDMQRTYLDLQKELILRTLDTSEVGSGRDALQHQRERLAAVDRTLRGLRRVSAALDKEYKKF